MQDHDIYIKQTRCWIDRVVIEFNLCPFARAPSSNDKIRYIVSKATKTKQLLIELEKEFEYLRQTPAHEVETTVLIHPFVLQDFFKYNDFLEDVDQLLEEKNLSDEFQVASLHPQYQFADTDFDDAENYTNRSPYPILHLLREDSVSQALSSYTRPERIPERNIRLMEKYGAEYMRNILEECMRED